MEQGGRERERERERKRGQGGRERQRGRKRDEGKEENVIYSKYIFGLPFLAQSS